MTIDVNTLSQNNKKKLDLYFHFKEDKKIKK
jgi:hypothetical protein